MLINSKFGKAGNKVVVEEFLDGIEISCFVLTDGNQYKVLPSTQIISELVKMIRDLILVVWAPFPLHHF